MKPIISLIHAGGSVSIIPAASPNIMIMYFIVITSLDVAPGVGTHDWVGAVSGFSTSGKKP
ncbi:MAG: hypothetical protein M3446_10075 [Actinomycetota bacterium]|nr:hypothetical protein [Actinomycetota bacterium]